MIENVIEWQTSDVKERLKFRPTSFDGSSCTFDNIEI
jgi:hypothetical protein